MEVWERIVEDDPGILYLILDFKSIGILFQGCQINLTDQPVKKTIVNYDKLSLIILCKHCSQMFSVDLMLPSHPLITFSQPLVGIVKTLQVIGDGGGTVTL